MRVYKFICKTPQGQEIRGLCKAENEDELLQSLRATGLELTWCEEKTLEGSNTIVSPDFTKQVAAALKALGKSESYKYMPTPRERVEIILLVLLVLAAGSLLYDYLDSRIETLERMNFQPNVVRQLHSHDIPDEAH